MHLYKPAKQVHHKVTAVLVEGDFVHSRMLC